MTVCLGGRVLASDLRRNLVGQMDRAVAIAAVYTYAIAMLPDLLTRGELHASLARRRLSADGLASTRMFEMPRVSSFLRVARSLCSRSMGAVHDGRGGSVRCCRDERSACVCDMQRQQRWRKFGRDWHDLDGLGSRLGTSQAREYRGARPLSSESMRLRGW